MDAENRRAIGLAEALSEEAVLHLDFSHREPKAEGRIDRRAPAAYVALLISSGSAKLIWGIAGARDIQEMIAHGACDTIEHLLAELPEDTLPKLLIFTRKDGYNKQVGQQIEKMRDARNPDKNWKRFIEMGGISRISGAVCDRISLELMDALNPILKEKVQLASVRRIHSDPENHEYHVENIDVADLLGWR